MIAGRDTDGGGGIDRLPRHFRRSTTSGSNRPALRAGVELARKMEACASWGTSPRALLGAVPLVFGCSDRTRVAACSAARDYGAAQATPRPSAASKTSSVQIAA